MNNLKRLTVCALRSHQWVRVPYPPDAEGAVTGHFLRCQRCGKENHDAGAVPRSGYGFAD